MTTTTLHHTVTISLPTTADVVDALPYSLPGDLRREILSPEGQTSVTVWRASDGGEARTLSQWSDGRGSLTDGSDSQWGDWTTDGRLLLDDSDGAWADEDGTVHEDE